MNELLPCEGNPFVLTARVKRGGASRVRFVAYGVGEQNAKYCDFGIPAQGWSNKEEKLVRVEFPISPAALRFEVIGAGGRPKAELHVEPMRPRWNAVDRPFRDFVHFAADFCKLAGTIPSSGKVYQDRDRKFAIRYMDRLSDSTAYVSDGPAACDMLTGMIDVAAAKFKSYSIPVRMFVLLHEYSHHILLRDYWPGKMPSKLPTKRVNGKEVLNLTSSEARALERAKNEAVVDQLAARQYSKLGFPPIEGVIAVTDVLKHLSLTAPGQQEADGRAEQATELMIKRYRKPR